MNDERGVTVPDIAGSELGWPRPHNKVTGQRDAERGAKLTFGRVQINQIYDLEEYFFKNRSDVRQATCGLLDSMAGRRDGNRRGQER